MSTTGDTSDHPVVEASSADLSNAEVTTRALRLRIRQQEILAELGVLALGRTSLAELLNQTARLTAEGMEVEFCKVLEYLPAQSRLLVRAGVGWNEGIVGVATVGADLESPSGFALHTAPAFAVTCVKPKVKSNVWNRCSRSSARRREASIVPPSTA